MRSVGDRPVMTVLAAEQPDKPEKKPKNRELRKKALIATVVVWAVAITAVVIFRSNGGGTKAPAVARPSASPSADAPLTVAQVYQTVLPSLVSIKSTGKSGTAASAAKSMT